MEIRSRQNREDATLSCSLGTASPYCFTNHLPALLHKLTYHVTYMLPNCITLHTNILQYFTLFAITLLYPLPLCILSYAVSLYILFCCYFAYYQLLYTLPHFIIIHVTCIELCFTLHFTLYPPALFYVLHTNLLLLDTLSQCYFTH